MYKSIISGKNMITNTQKVTAEFCALHGKTGGGGIIFFPETTGEAQAILDKLASFGYRKDKKQAKENETCFLDACRSKGLMLISGQIQWNDFGGLRGVVSCKPEQLLDETYVPPEELALRELFSRVHARQDALEEKLDRILSILEPQPIKKNFGG